MGRHHDLVDIEVRLHHKSAKAILVSDDGDEANAVWLPLSQIEIDDQGKNGVVTVTVPEWLAIDKGLV